MMNKRNLDIAYFLSFCIEQYKKEKNISGAEAVLNLKQYGVLDRESLIRELKTYKLVDQYLFHTEESLRYLSFLEAKEVIL